MPEQLRPFGTSLVRQCPQGLFCPDLKSTHSPWISEDETDQSKCSTLQSQSLGRYSRRMTSYRSLRYFTYEKLFQWHLVCHKFLSITFAFRGCSRSAKGLNCRLDRRQTGKIPKPICVFEKNRNFSVLYLLPSAGWRWSKTGNSIMQTQNTDTNVENEISRLCITKFLGNQIDVQTK